MIISKLYNSLSLCEKCEKEDLVFGLVYGLFFGLVLGLFFGLFLGLFFGLVFGLASGLIVILFNWSEALFFLTNIYLIILLVVGIIVVSEIMFWLMPNEKVKPNDIFWHTFKRKMENIFEVLIVLSVITQVYILIREIRIKISEEIISIILKWVGYVGEGIIGLAIIILLFYVWIKLNSYKYRIMK